MNREGRNYIHFDDEASNIYIHTHVYTRISEQRELNKRFVRLKSFQVPGSFERTDRGSNKETDCVRGNLW